MYIRTYNVIIAVKPMLISNVWYMLLQVQTHQIQNYVYYYSIAGLNLNLTLACVS